MADAIKRCADNLRALDVATSGQAESVTALLEQRDTLIDGIGKAEGRYRAAGEALETYSAALDRVQADTLNALYAAGQAKWERDEARDNQRYYQDLADDYAGTDDDSSYGHDQWVRYTRLANSAGQDAVDAQNRIDNQVQVVENAVQERDQAAQTAIDAIQGVTATDGLNDGWWEDYGAKLLGWIADIAEAIAGFVGLLAIALGWIPVLGQALAAISAIAGIVAAVANIGLALAGEKSWGEALISVGFAALGCFGLGGTKMLGNFAVRKMFTQTLKMAGTSTKGSLAGAFYMRTLLRRGAVGRISRGGGRNAMVGRLGEEMMRIKPRGKIHYEMGAHGGKPGQGRIPDIARPSRQGLQIGDVKFVKELSWKAQLKDFARIVRTEPTDKILHIYHPRTYTSPKSTTLFTQWASKNDIRVELHHIEDFVGKNAGSQLAGAAGTGQVLKNMDFPLFDTQGRKTSDPPPSSPYPATDWRP
ncbi:hypothetical protein [Buchananella felis]|uniref:hypothetical protein n=1 Tax=Buchananella felis TaxID=3231492 RepID=UPI003527E838